nr:MAG TPA: RimK-related lysine biosynthesis protein, Probable-dependent amine/thiol ligase family Amino-group [Caudoviricetes sp.]
MSEYIKKEDVLEIVKHTRGDYAAAFSEIRKLPTADVEPVVHGKWLPTNDKDKKRCSNCDVIHLICQYPNGNINFCPNCGAKMDLE